MTDAIQQEPVAPIPARAQVEERWPGILALLGDASVSLAEIGRRYGISRARVQQLAQSCGAPRRSRHPPAVTRLTPAMQENLRVHLGTKTDAALAVEWGLPVGTVRNFRHRLGVDTPAGKRNARLRDIRQEVTPLLGTLSDHEIARRYGVTPQTVARWRAQVCPVRPRTGRPLRAHDRAVLFFLRRLDPEKTYALYDLNVMALTQIQVSHASVTHALATVAERVEPGVYRLAPERGRAYLEEPIRPLLDRAAPATGLVVVPLHGAWTARLTMPSGDVRWGFGTSPEAAVDAAQQDV